MRTDADDARAVFTHQSVVAAASAAASADGAAFATVDLVLEMTATLDADGFPLPPLVSREDVAAALQRAGGDVALAVDEVLSVVAIRQLRADEQRAREAQQQLQWHELCAGLGVREGDAFMRALERLPDDDKSALVSSDGGFLQQLLLELDEEEARERAAAADAHPVAQLQAMYPDYRLEVLERVLEQHAFDVNAAADALHNLRGVDSVQSFAAVVSAQGRAAQQQQELRVHGPDVDSLGHFPVLPAAVAPRQKLSQKQRRQQQQHLHGYHRKPSRLAKLNGARVNAWERQDLPVSSGAVLESTLSSELKIDRLKSLLPTVDRGVIQTTFFLNGCNSDVSEAALREIFSLPVVAQQAEIADDDDDAAAEDEADGFSSSSFTDTPSYASSRARVDAARDALSDRYCAVLESFQRNRNGLTGDRVRELSHARREVRECQREAAHQFFLAHADTLRQRRPIDLHGLIVMEALQVANEAIEFCREQRIRRCLLICGAGHHSAGGRARILTAMQISLNRRQIPYRSNGGMLTIFPLRSTTQAS